MYWGQRDIAVDRRWFRQPISLNHVLSANEERGWKSMRIVSVDDERLQLTGEFWRPSAERQSSVAPHKSINVPSCSTFDSSLIWNEIDKYLRSRLLLAHSPVVLSVEPIAIPAGWKHRPPKTSRATSHTSPYHRRTFLWDALSGRRWSWARPSPRCLAILSLSPVRKVREKLLSDVKKEIKKGQPMVKMENIQHKTT